MPKKFFLRPQEYHLPFSPPITIIPLAVRPEAGKIIEEFFKDLMDAVDNLHANFPYLLSLRNKSLQSDYVEIITKLLQELRTGLSYKRAKSFKSKLLSLYSKELPKEAFFGNNKSSPLHKNWYIYHPEAKELMNYWFHVVTLQKEYLKMLAAYKRGH